MTPPRPKPRILPYAADSRRRPKWRVRPLAYFIAVLIPVIYATAFFLFSLHWLAALNVTFASLAAIVFVLLFVAFYTGATVHEWERPSRIGSEIDEVISDITRPLSGASQERVNMDSDTGQLVIGMAIFGVILFIPAILIAILFKALYHIVDEATHHAYRFRQRTAAALFRASAFTALYAAGPTVGLVLASIAARWFLPR